MRSASSPKIQTGLLQQPATMEVPERVTAQRWRPDVTALWSVRHRRSSRLRRISYNREIDSQPPRTHVTGSPSCRGERYAIRQFGRGPNCGAQSAGSRANRGNPVETVKGQCRRGDVRPTDQLTVDCLPKRGGAQRIRPHHGRKPEPGKPRPSALAPPILALGFHNWPFAKVHRLGHRIVAAHADNGIGSVYRGDEVRVEVDRALRLVGCRSSP